MIDFEKIAQDLYIVVKDGERITDVPMSRSELIASLCGLKLTESDLVFIERFFNGEVN